MLFFLNSFQVPARPLVATLAPREDASQVQELYLTWENLLTWENPGSFLF